MELLRERNTSTIIYFPLIIAGGTAFATSGDWTPASGDADYSVDGGTFGSTNGTVAYEGNGIWSLSLLGTEINGKVTVITIQDTEIQDQAIIIQTWGDDSAGLPLNAIADFVLRRSAASARASSRGDSVIFRSLLGAVSKIVNRLYRSGTNLLTTEENDTTTFGTQAVTTSDVAEQITDLDTT